MTYFTITFEISTTMNHVKKCESSYWPNRIKWVQQSDLKAMLELKDDPEVLNSALSAFKNKYEDAGGSADETELVATLIAEATKEY